MIENENQASLKSFDPGKLNVCAGSSGQGRGWQRLDVAVEGGVFFVWGTVAGFVFVAVLEVCGLLTLLLTMRFWFKRVEAGFVGTLTGLTTATST